jgi:putative ABC transport system substrate-binding protein
MIRRRDFITLLGGAAAGWPITARAQQGERIRRIGALMLISEADPRSEGYVASFRQRLQELGWVDDRNTIIDIRWGLVTPPVFVDTRLNWLRLRPMSFWPRAVHLWWR